MRRDDHRARRVNWMHLRTKLILLLVQCIIMWSDASRMIEGKDELKYVSGRALLSALISYSVAMNTIDRHKMSKGA